MRVHHATGEVKANGFGNTSNFKIAMTAHAFKILSSQVYGNPVLATIREVVCNAYDAHVKAGTLDTPVEVQLPSHLDPMFIVKDFGTGLSPDAVRRLLTTYFESDKNDSDELIGGLGIGAKAPFSVTNSFIVESRWNGLRYTFAAVMGPEGLPAITQQDEVLPTDEHNGLTIYVPVPSDKISAFRSTAPDILARFKPLPKVTGAEVKPMEYRQEGDRWGIRQERGSHNAIAVMGNVPYEIERYNIQDITTEQISVLDLPIDITFNIGELEIQASREGLHYTSETQATIRARLNSIIAGIQDTFACEVAGAKTLAEAKLTYARIVGDHYQLQSILRDKLEWNGVKINSSGLELPGFHSCIDLNTHSYRRRKTSPKVTSLRTDTYVDLAHTGFLIRDVKFHLAPRIILWHSQGGNADYNYYVISDESFIPKLEEMGLSYTRISTMPEPPRTHRERRPREMKKILRFDPISADFVTTEHDVSKGGIYVDLYRGDVKHPDGDMIGNHTLKRMLCLPNIGPIYAFPASYKDIPSRNEDWHSLWPLLEAQARLTLTSKDYLQHQVDMKSWLTVGHKDFIGHLSWLNKKCPFTSSRVLDLINAYDHLLNLKENDQYKAAEVAAEQLGIVLNMRKPKPSVDVAKLWNRLVKARPMTPLLTTARLTLEGAEETLRNYLN